MQIKCRTWLSVFLLLGLGLLNVQTTIAEEAEITAEDPGDFYSLIVYCTQPSPGTSNSLSSVGNAFIGHAWIDLVKVNQGVPDIITSHFYPGGHLRSYASGWKALRDVPYHAKLVLEITKKQYVDIEWIIIVANQHPDDFEYNMVTYNCCHWVNELLGVIGLDLGLSNFPGSMGEDLIDIGGVRHPDAITPPDETIKRNNF